MSTNKTAYIITRNADKGRPITEDELEEMKKNNNILYVDEVISTKELGDDMTLSEVTVKSPDTK